MTTSRRCSRSARLLATAVLAVSPMLVPTPGAAAPGQDDPSTTPTEVDPLVASSGDVVSSLDDLGADVTTQVDAVLAARAAAATAEADLAAADAAVAETESLIVDLTTRSDEVVIDTFINPPSENALETLGADSLSDATVRQSILTRQSDANAEVLDALDAAQEDLATRKDAQDEAAAAAEEQSGAAAAALEDLVASQSAESLFVLAVEDRLAASLAEADALASIDPEAAAAIRAREGEIAGTIEGLVAAREERAAQAALEQAMADAAAQAAADAAARAEAPSGGSSLGPSTGSLADVACPGGGSITVDSSLAGNLRSLLAAASAAGNNMCGGGYRDPAAQIALRRANCGSSNYAIYEAPSSSCSPPTAPPGSSNHEQGLAIDFTCNGGGALGSGSPCFSWLQSNAASYGLYNLPSEPWHWSNDGT